MISRKTVVAYVFSTIVSMGMLAVPGAAVAHDWHHGHHDSGCHKGWDNYSSWGKHNGCDNHRRWEEEHEDPGYYQQPYANRYGHQQSYREGYGWNPPIYNYDEPRNARPDYGIPPHGEGMVSARHPGLVWTCNSKGHHCHWAARPGYRSVYSQAGLNPFAYGGADDSYDGGGYNYNYANGYAPMDGLASLLGPMFGGQRP